MTTGAEWRTGLTYTRVHGVCSPGVKNKHRQSRAMRAACTSGRQARGQVPTASAGEELWRHSHSLVSGVPDLPQRAKGHYHNDGSGTIYFSSTPPLPALHVAQQGAQECAYPLWEAVALLR